MKDFLTVPNILTLIRICMVPILLYVSWKGFPSFFLGLLVFSFFTDALDGFIARTFNLQTELGAKLDSLADFSVYMAIPVCAWLLWPEVIRQEMIFVIAVVLSIVLPVLIGVIKFGRYPSYHTWLTKLAAASMATASILLFLGGPSWVFRLAVILCVCAALEEIIITFLLSEPRSNVRGLWRVIKDRRKHV